MDDTLMNDDLFFTSVRKSLFGGVMTQPQVDGCNTILAACDDYPVTLASQKAYILASAYHESGRAMEPVREVGEGKGHSYGLPAGPYHQVYYGRGLIQLTWEAGYANATQKLHALGFLAPDKDLVKTPDLALDPDISAMILVVGCCQGWFTGKKLSDFISANKTNWIGAREVVNGHDRDSLIAGYARSFYSAILAASDTKATS